MKQLSMLIVINQQKSKSRAKRKSLITRNQTSQSKNISRDQIVSSIIQSAVKIFNEQGKNLIINRPGNGSSVGKFY